MSSTSRLSSVCLRCDATDCTDDACTGYGEAPVDASEASDVVVAACCAADVEINLWWEGGE